jgi:hypothetical protein
MMEDTYKKIKKLSKNLVNIQPALVKSKVES